MQLSPYQLSIRDWVSSQLASPEEKKHLLIKAVAGAGKTTTLVSICNQIPLDQKVLVVCFNKHISLDLTKKVPSNCKVQTLNSLGYQIIRDNGLKPKVDSWKTSNIFKQISPTLQSRYYAHMNQIISLLKADYSESGHSTISEILDKYDISKPKEKLPYLHVLEASLCDKKVIDFDDQLVYPIYYKMGLPAYDWILIDEAQDLSIVQSTLLLKLTEANKRYNTRIVAVGDPSQCIYAFRGAAIGSMDILQSKLEADILPLSVCYRCPKSVVRYAKTLYPTIEEYEGQKEGTVSRILEEDFNPQVGDTILCRTNAPLMSTCLRLLSAKKLAMVKGDDIRKSVENLFKKTHNLEGLIEYRKKVDWSKKSKNARIKLTDELDMMAYLYRYAEYSGDTISHLIERIFGETKLPHILLSSIHKAKGLEWDTVYIIRPDQLPHPQGDPEQEKNIAYVAVTRAKKQLIFVDSNLE